MRANILSSFMPAELTQQERLWFETRDKEQELRAANHRPTRTQQEWYKAVDTLLNSILKENV